MYKKYRMLVHNEKVKWANKIGQDKWKLSKITCNKNNLRAFFFQEKNRPMIKG